MLLRAVVYCAVLLLFSCQRDAPTKIHGYEFKIFSDPSGTVPEPGQYVFFAMDLRDDKGKLLQSFRDEIRNPSLKIEKAESKKRKNSPIMEALTYMSVGDSSVLIIPRDSIPNLSSNYADLLHAEYHLVLNSIMNEEEYNERIVELDALKMAALQAMKDQLPSIESLANETIEDYKSGTLDVITTASGLKYHIHEMGKGPMPTKGRQIRAMYYGALVSDATMFDNSYKNGADYPFRVGVGHVIKGWDEGFLLFPEGTKASLFIPSSLGYGEAGSPPAIPENAELYFYVESSKVQL